VNLSFHAAIWGSCLVLAALAPAIVRVYASHLERRTRANADELLARFFAGRSAPVDARLPREPSRDQST